jgi:hypothetical protein
MNFVLFELCQDLHTTLGDLLDKLEALGGCNEHDLNGENILPEITATREMIAKAEAAGVTARPVITEEIEP